LTNDKQIQGILQSACAAWPVTPDFAAHATAKIASEFRYILSKVHMLLDYRCHIKRAHDDHTCRDCPWKDIAPASPGSARMFGATGVCGVASALLASAAIRLDTALGATSPLASRAYIAEAP
jgi:hypothetical protein